ncbi:hypothetical protein SAMN04488550_2636 [Gordonia malaquae]|uniref:Uncharacterized protein n=1 Tax=Gordonia malaquae NBRC 108250 TaxID=1223542 RepID=M3VGA8_GORML|nr:hypothetical protein GM1_021_00400 [Gordonia malaquae NBRC 108250]SED50469.1 hypothetical protein SAMN04488550_2636 [Gordonia malaquae]
MLIVCEGDVRMVNVSIRCLSESEQLGTELDSDRSVILKFVVFVVESWLHDTVSREMPTENWDCV